MLRRVDFRMLALVLGFFFLSQVSAQQIAGGGGAGGGTSYTPPNLTVSGVTANAQLSSTALPANAYILYALVRETAGHSVNVGMGTTSGGTDVLPATAVPASGTVEDSTGAFQKIWFSNGSTQAIYLTSAAWNSASVNVTLYYMIPPS